MGGLLLLAGCQSSANKSASAPPEPKWKGAPYRLAFDTKPAKPGPTGIDIPTVTYTANPDALETRADLVLRFMATGAGNKDTSEHLMIGTATDIHGAEGKLPDDYMEEARKGLANYLVSYCLKGKIDLKVALASSSLDPHGDIGQVDDKRLSDWLPLEITYKNTHPKCK
jgi:hypothetical protein